MADNNAKPTKEAELDAKEAELDVKEAELDAKEAELDVKEAELDVKEAELDATEAKLDATEAELRATEAELCVKEAELRVKEAELREKKAGVSGLIRKRPITSVVLITVLSLVFGLSTGRDSPDMSRYVSRTIFQIKEAELNKAKEQHKEELEKARTRLNAYTDVISYGEGGGSSFPTSFFIGTAPNIRNPIIDAVIEMSSIKLPGPVDLATHPSWGTNQNIVIISPDTVFNRAALSKAVDAIRGDPKFLDGNAKVYNIQNPTGNTNKVHVFRDEGVYKIKDSPNDWQQVGASITL